MRAFIAVEVESEKLKEVQKQLDIHGVKLTNHFHITLKFFREIDEKTVNKIKTILSTLKFKQFEIELDGLGVFPEPDYVKVIWVRVKSDDLLKLQKEVDEKLIEMFERDMRFSAHITLGRVKFVSDKRLLLDRLMSIKIEAEKFLVKEIRFIKSTLELEGPVYEDLAVFKAD